MKRRLPNALHEFREVRLRPAILKGPGPDKVDFRIGRDRAISLTARQLREFAYVFLKYADNLDDNLISELRERLGELENRVIPDDD